VSRRLRFELDFPVTYEVTVLSHIDRSGGRRAYEFPGARELGPQRELSTGPILDVRPAEAEPWVGIATGRASGLPIDPE
jgi:hypothetical protein